MKTVIEMAREAGAHENFAFEGEYFDMSVTSLERFAELVRADERGICSDLDFRKEIGLTSDQDYKVSQLILFRGNT